MITLRVRSPLDAVGLTAAVSSALAAREMSCNLVAGHYHDHVFVRFEHLEAAMDALRALSR